MKKATLLILIVLGSIAAKAQHPLMRVYFADSVLNNQLSPTPLPQVAISGYYDNLLHIPNISINGISHAVTDGQSWTTSSSAPTIPVLPKSANYTVTTSDFGSAKVLYVPVDCTSGAVTITAPTASTVGGYTIVLTKTDATANALTISGLGSDNVISVQTSAKQIISNGSTYIQQ